MCPDDSHHRSVEEMQTVIASDDWYLHFQMGKASIAEGRAREAVEHWIDAFDRMGIEDFDDSFREVAGLYEDYIASTLWKSIDELDISNCDDLAYTIFTNFPEKRCEDTDLLIVLLKRMNAHLDDVNHVRYLVDLLDVCEMLVRKYFDMNVEIRTHMYASDIILGIGSLVILKSVPMLESIHDAEESARTIKIVGEILGIFTKIRDSIFYEVESRTREEVNEIVAGWSRRCTAEYMTHLDRAFELSMTAFEGGRLDPETLQAERDREVERYVAAYFGKR